MFKKFLPFLFAGFLMGCNDETAPETPSQNNKPSAVGTIGFNVVNVYPHDTSHFTEGLLLHDNFLFESTGLEGRSHVMKIELSTGKTVRKVSLPGNLFGEGISIIGDRIYQLTWQDHVVKVYDVNTFKEVAEYNWPYQGWGMTTNGTDLFISTGSNNIYQVDPSGFKIKKIISVNDQYGPLSNINELELVNNYIYANIWQTPYIVKIDMESGTVVGRLDLSDIWRKANIAEPLEKDVANGIAYDAVKGTFYITGKHWPTLFEIKLQ